ncbi:MAG: hypothetical protein CL908_26905 [Deltaproteobacteria bacterium]|nr:hypothetical protein [Deltaproteobacteria bacterium]
MMRAESQGTIETMKLAELIDLESQLLRDEAATRDGEGRKLLERDRAIGEAVLRELSVDAEGARSLIASDVGFRHRAAGGWLAQLRGKVKRLPGARMERGYALVGWILGALGVVLGVGAASAALHYDGSRPVNVSYFIAVFVGLQVTLLVAMILMMALRRAVGTSTLIGWAQAFVVWLSRARWVDKLLRDLPEDAGGELASVRSRTSLYGGVERWLLFGLTQKFGVLFNLSALVTCLMLVVFTDLTFSWSTTLNLTGEELHGIVETIGAPWSWCLGDAVPDSDTIQRSEWVRHGTPKFEGKPSLEDVQKWGSVWWRFLVMSLIVWGLLPRLLAFLFAQWRVRRSLARTDLAHGAFQRLFERLVPPPAGWSAPAPEDVAAPPPAKRPQRRRATRRKKKEGATKTPAKEPTAQAIAWGRLARHRATLPPVVERRFGWDVGACHSAGGAKLEDDAACVDALVGAAADRVVLLVEAGVQPTKEVVGFLVDVRERLGARAQLVVGLLAGDPDGWHDADAEEVQQWQSRLDAVGDPYLRVERMVATA